MSSSALLMMPTVVMPKVPRCERTKSGCGSVSLMQPMPLHPVEACQVVFEFRSKRRVFNRMDFSLESGFGVEENHACTRVFPDGSGNRRRRTRREPRHRGMRL